jgi:hypothetical protein
MIAAGSAPTTWHQSRNRCHVRYKAGVLSRARNATPFDAAAGACNNGDDTRLLLGVTAYRTLQRCSVFPPH